MIKVSDTVSAVMQWFAVAHGDVDEPVRIVCINGAPVVGLPEEMIDIAQALANEHRAVFRVLKLTEFARVCAKRLPEIETT